MNDISYILIFIIVVIVFFYILDRLIDKRIQCSSDSLNKDIKDIIENAKDEIKQEIAVDVKSIHSQTYSQVRADRENMRKCKYNNGFN